MKIIRTPRRHSKRASPRRHREAVGSRRIFRSAIALAALLVLHGGASAQQRRPGLWELEIESSGMAANIPPDVLAKMQAQGIAVPGPHTLKHQHCVTPEQAQKDALPMPTRPEDQCQTRNYQMSASTISVDLVCDGKFKGQGSVKGVLDSDTSYHGSLDLTGSATLSNGVSRPIEMHTKFSGHWLAADCGSAAPAPPPK